MKKLIPLIILSLSFPFTSAYAQKVETKDIRGNWYIAPYFHYDSLEFNFLDTCVTLTLIRNWHTSDPTSDQLSRIQTVTTINYHLIKFKKERLIVFDINPDPFISSTYLVKQPDHNTLKLQRIQDADFRGNNLRWSQKQDSATLIAKRSL
ncbi:MAG TPA: hypothetical protein VMI35_14525 [Puia sp.]|nr:hypothetical protein [Puia sp.]